MLTGCIAGAVNAPAKTTVNAGDQAKRSFLLSDTADAFSGTSAGDAKDCSTYAIFIGLGLFQKTEAEQQTSRDVVAVWREVFDRKTDAEKKIVNGSREARAEARRSGSLDKLSAEKCIIPVVAEMERVF